MCVKKYSLSQKKKNNDVKFLINIVLLVGTLNCVHHKWTSCMSANLHTKKMVKIFGDGAILGKGPVLYQSQLERKNTRHWFTHMILDCIDYETVCKTFEI